MYPDSYMEPVYLLQKFGCIYNFAKDPFKTSKLLWMIYIAIGVFISEGFYLPDFLYVMPSLKYDAGILIDHLCITVSIFLVVFKAAVCFVRKKSLTELIERLEDPRFRYEDCDEYRPGVFTASSSQRFGVFVKILVVLYLGVDYSRHVVSLITFFVDGRLVEAGNATCDEYLAYYLRTPFPSDTFSGCGFAIVSQMIMSFVINQQLIAVETTFIGICMYTRCHFINLEGAFRTMKLRCLRRLDLRDNLEIFHYEQNPRLEEELKKELRKMSVHLQMLFDVVGKIEAIFNVTVLAMILTVMLIVSTCLYSIATVSLNDPHLYIQAQFAVTALVLIAPYCYFGEEIQNRCFNLRDAVYETDWLPSSRSFKTTIMVHLIRLQVPMHLTVGKFAPLTFNTFIKVMKTSYAYFILLSCMRDK